jgi:hypothetical protein
MTKLEAWLRGWRKQNRSGPNGGNGDGGWIRWGGP